MLVAYSQAQIDTSRHVFEVMPFIDDMAQAYSWADVVICRAGALTVTEIASVGVAAIFCAATTRCGRPSNRQCQELN